MPRRADRLRPVRAGVLGTVILLLTLLGHAAGRAALPGPAGLGIAGALAFALAAALGARRLRLLALLPLLVLSQAVLHLVLDVTAHHDPAPLTVSMAVGHLLAAGAAALVLAHGESVAGRWISYLRQHIGAPALVTRPVPAAPLARCTEVPRPTTHVIPHAVIRRGPPRGLALAH